MKLMNFVQHRHPYIERLGLLYMLKLRNGKHFGTQAGAGWRMLFVLALLPWMRKYRVVIPTKLGADRMLLTLESVTERSTRSNLDGSSNLEGENNNNDNTQTNNKMVSWTPTESIRSLAAKRSVLKQQLKDLNNLLSQKLSDAKNHPAKMTIYERHALLQDTKCDVSYVSTLSV